MVRDLKLELKTASINSLYYANVRHGKTKAAKEWTLDVFRQLRKYETELTELREYFEPANHVYGVSMKILIPEHVLFTKAGELTSLVHDLSNVEKPLIDLLFLPKHFNECPQLNVDDRYLCYLRSAKVPTKNSYGIELTIEILSKPLAA